MRGEQAIFNLEIKKKSGLSINPDIHHSKVFSSDLCSSIRIPNPLFDLFNIFLASFLINMVVDGISYSFGILLEPMKMVGIFSSS